jgi:hypothetical protein
MTPFKRNIIFIVAMLLLFVGLIMLQGWSDRTGNHFPKWPIVPVIMMIYYFLFPQKTNKK